MKKYFLTIVLLSIFTLPVFAVCSITGGACSFDSSPSYNEFNPNRLNNIQKYDLNKTNSVSPDINPFNERQNQIPQTEGYDANCQFGICLPKTDLK